MFGGGDYMRVAEYNEKTGVIYRDMTKDEEAGILKEHEKSPEHIPTMEEDIYLLKKQNKELAEKNEMLTECILELADIIYA